MGLLKKSLPLAGAFLAAVMVLDGAAGQEVNLYSSRHYQTDERLYEGFTEKTGIEINRIEGEGDALIARLTSEGDNSPADVFLTVDVGRLYRAEQAGLFQGVESATLEERILPQYRHPDGLWYGFSSRARLIYYDKQDVDPGEITTYEGLADPKWKGKVCIRSSSNVYNQSLLASLIVAHGKEKAEEWAKGVVENFARDPQGGDTDQLRAVAAGECDLAVANSYYFVRLMRSDEAEDKKVVDRVGWIFPNQDGRGAHVNLSGGGVARHAPHPDAALAFLEYLASDAAQRYFADGNNEFPIVQSVDANEAVEKLGDFKADTVEVSSLGPNIAEAQRIFDRVGWK